MNLKCAIGLHEWVVGTCMCAICEKEKHDWRHNCEKCSKCRETREQSHVWNGCKCSVCKMEHHDWSQNCEKCAKCGKERPNGQLIDEATVRELANTYGLLEAEGASIYETGDAKKGLVNFPNRLAVCKVISDMIIRRDYPKAVETSYPNVVGAAHYVNVLEQIGSDVRFLDDYIQMCRAVTVESNEWGIASAAALVLCIEGGWERVRQEFNSQEARLLIMCALIRGPDAVDYRGHVEVDYAGRLTDAEARLAISTIMGDKELDSFGSRRCEALARVGLPALDTLLAIYRKQGPEADEQNDAAFSICTMPGSLEVLIKRWPVERVEALIDAGHERVADGGLWCGLYAAYYRSLAKLRTPRCIALLKEAQVAYEGWGRGVHADVGVGAFFQSLVGNDRCS